MVVYSGLMAGVKGFPDAVKSGCLLCGTGLKGQFQSPNRKHIFFSLHCSTELFFFFNPSAAEMSAFLLNVIGLDGTLLVVKWQKNPFGKLNSWFFSRTRDPVTESNPQTLLGASLNYILST